MNTRSRRKIEESQIHQQKQKDPGWRSGASGGRVVGRQRDGSKRGRAGTRRQMGAKKRPGIALTARGTPSRERRRCSRKDGWITRRRLERRKTCFSTREAEQAGGSCWECHIIMFDRVKNWVGGACAATRGKKARGNDRLCCDKLSGKRIHRRTGSHENRREAWKPGEKGRRRGVPGEMVQKSE